MFKIVIKLIVIIIVIIVLFIAYFLAKSLFLWRDEINEMGGICLDKITSKSNTCSQKYISLLFLFT